MRIETALFGDHYSSTCSTQGGRDKLDAWIVEQDQQHRYGVVGLVRRRMCGRNISIEDYADAYDEAIVRLYEACLSGRFTPDRSAAGWLYCTMLREIKKQQEDHSWERGYGLADIDDPETFDALMHVVDEERVTRLGPNARAMLDVVMHNRPHLSPLETTVLNVMIETWGDGGRTNAEFAQRATAKLGRTVTEGTVSTTLNSLRKRLWAELYRRGIVDDPTPPRRVRGRRSEVFGDAA